MKDKYNTIQPWIFKAEI